MRKHPYPLLFALYSFLALFWTWPLGAHLNTRVAHDPGDPILNTWILWWNAQAVPFTDAWWSPPIFFPMRDALALSEHLAGLGPLSTPLLLAGVSPLGAYNATLILTYALSAFFAYLLVAHLTGSRLAGFCGGVAFGFAPYRAGQLAHLQVLASQWMPLALLALHRYVGGRRRRWLVIFGVAWLLQALSNGYYLLFFPVLIALWLAWFVDWRQSPRAGLAILGAWLAASLPLVPLLLKYRSVHESLALHRPLGEIQRYSATLASFTHGAPLLALAPARDGTTDETFLFPGFFVVGLIVAAGAFVLLRRRDLVRTAIARRSPFLFYGAAALIMWTLAFGPDGPYRLLWYLPGFEGLRVPARFAMLATLCLAVAAGIAVSRLTATRSALAALCAAGLALDGWPRPMPLFPPPSRITLPDVRDAAVLELPPDDPAVGVTSMYRAMFHRRPVISAYSGHTPPHTSLLATALRREDPSVLTELAHGRPLIIVVDERRDRGGDFRRLVRDLPGIERYQTTGAGEVYVLPASAPPRTAQRGTPLRYFVDEDAAGRRIDLGDVKVVRTIEFPLRERYVALYTRMSFETSEDGASWTTVWEDWTGGPALAGVLRDPREAPVRVMVPDVRARYVRFGPAHEWLWRELRLYGP